MFAILQTEQMGKPAGTRLLSRAPKIISRSEHVPWKWSDSSKWGPSEPGLPDAIGYV